MSLYNPKPTKKVTPSRHSGGTSGKLSIKGHKTQTPVVPYEASEPSHIPGVAGATKKSAAAVLARQAKRVQRARALQLLPQNGGTAGSPTQDAAPNRSRLKISAPSKPKLPPEPKSKPVHVKPTQTMGYVPPVKALRTPKIVGPTMKTRAIAKAAARKLPPQPLGAFRKPKTAKRYKQHQRYGVPQPQLSPTLQHPKATLVAEKKLTRAKQALAKARPDNSVSGQIASVLLKKGLNKTAIAGILGNASQESGINPGSVGSGGGGLWGFTAGEISLESLQHYAAEKGANWEDPKLQTRFLNEHLPEETKAKLNSASSPQEAAKIFQDQWEHPAVATENQAHREEAAGEAFSSGAISRPNPKAVRNYKAAVKNAQSLGLDPKKGFGSPAPGKPAPYANPLPEKYWSPGRSDQGFDAAPKTENAPILAVGRGKVIATGIGPSGPAAGWPGEGGVVYKLLEGPQKGKEIFVFEAVAPTVKPGQVIKRGQIIARYVPKYPSSLETGYYDTAGGHPYNNQLLSNPAVTYSVSSSDGQETIGSAEFQKQILGKAVDVAASGGGAIITGGGSVIGGGAIASYAGATGESPSEVRRGIRSEQITPQMIFKKLKAVGVGNKEAPTYTPKSEAEKTLSALKRKYGVA